MCSRYICASLGKQIALVSAYLHRVPFTPTAVFHGCCLPDVGDTVYFKYAPVLPDDFPGKHDTVFSADAQQRQMIIMQGDIDDPDIVGLLQDESRVMSAAWLDVTTKQLI